jgi:pimeloyl-[acyl-carrier protein] synthase
MNTAAFNLGDAGTLGFEVFPILNQLRESEPVHWNEAGRCWVVSRHQDIMDALSGSLPLSNLRLTAASLSVIPIDEWPRRLPNMSHYSRYHITNMDPPNHTRLRKLMTKAFGKPVVEGMRPFVRARVAALMDVLRAHKVVEFNGEIARELPGRVLLELLHFPEAIFPRLMSWAHEVMVGLGTPNPKAEWVEAADRAFAEMTEHFLVQIADRRRQSRGPEDFISALVTARDGQDGLTDDEIVALLETVMVAGHDTTTNSMTLGVAALAQHPEIWAYMRQNPEKTLESVLEIMRYTAMSAAQNRAVGADFEWHGKQLKKGDVVFLMLAAGNRDPRAFQHPEQFDPTRNNDNSLTFAPGLHHCVGHLLAKMQLTEFFSALTQQFSAAEILDEKIQFSPIVVFRSIPSLHMRFRP